ncbi:tail fiber protein [uncultured Vibrio sp.]|uniref:tail fiber protein n=1 Tax=uncultured Vibrio sp. TaxID=114054 RepID=UPI002623899E|nr:tail fiber protein [uncultured Vibrio sp.]
MSALHAIPTPHGIDILNSELKNTVTGFQLIGALTDSAPNESLYVFHHDVIETSYYDEHGVLTFIINLPIELHFDEYLHRIHVLDTQALSVIECSTPKVALSKGVGGIVTLKVDISGEAGEVIFKHGEFVTEAELLDLYLPLKEDSDNAANDSDIDNESSDLKHIKLPQLWRAFSKKIKNASTTVAGIVQTSTSLTSTRSDVAASAFSVKTLNDKINNLNHGFNSGQVWELKNDRALNITYTNSHDYPIQIHVMLHHVGTNGGTAKMLINNNIMGIYGRPTTPDSTEERVFSMIIPAGSTYYASTTGGSWGLSYWSQLS